MNKRTLKKSFPQNNEKKRKQVAFKSIIICVDNNSQEKQVELFQMNHLNWKHLIYCVLESFDDAASSYICDICKHLTSIENTIYTNSQCKDIDICTKCVLKILANKKTFLFKDSNNILHCNVYSLKSLSIISTNNNNNN